MTVEGYCKVLLDIKDIKIIKLESEITKFRIEYEKQIVKLQKENKELKELVEKYRQAVDKCLHITFMVVVVK